MDCLHSPACIEFFLHCHYSPEQHKKMGLPIFQEFASDLIEAGMIYRTSGQAEIYSCTERGKAHVKQLCQLKFPKAQFVNEHGEVINDCQCVSAPPKYEVQ